MVYIYSMDYDAYRPYRGHHALPSRHLFDQILLHRPNRMSSGSMFPILNEVVWQTPSRSTFPYITLFLVPSVVSLEINCYGGKLLAHACIEALELLAPMQIALFKLELRILKHDHAFLHRLPTVFAYQTRLVHLGLPPYCATRQVVKALGRLPDLEDYLATFFEEYQSLMNYGKEFDWELGAFPVLKKVTLYTSLAEASSIMARPYQPRLTRFTLSNRETFRDGSVYDLCSSLSASQSSITTIGLLMYSDKPSEFTARSPMPFSLFHPLLHCRGLTELRLESHIMMAYDDADISSMASAWPDVSTLSLCPAPDLRFDLDGGQPLRSVSAFTRSFAHLKELGLYINTLDVDTISDAHLVELSVLDLGSSIAAHEGVEDAVSVVSEYVAKVIKPQGKLKAGRSVSHIRFLLLDDTDGYDTRAAFWSTVAANVEKIHDSGKDRGREEPRR
ncbi:hypothetical protein FRB96_002181 [Tulasnella sp. 330]|nr:hypothetical protein FRB96_002181 [Tulasnella sp. 330]KAG8873511.1 hypothetical protein FRB97_006670 [Tulasnella sp. 331]KAG8877585.1 hypothetical protein FRB98_006620 [Tulasnella sp. 332]